VSSSVGHVRDLPVKTLGVDINHGFEPKYVVAKGKKKVIDQLRRDARACDEIYLAPDPDREGEAIAWHILEVLKDGNAEKPFFRVQYNEITAGAVREAFKHPGTLNMDRVAAQQARRVLDRIVGYMVSPVLWRRIKRGLSAGRVQSVALRLTCEREKEIRAFVPEAFWVLGASVRKLVVPLEPFTVRLARIDGEKPDIKSEEQATAVMAELDGSSLKVSKVEQKTVEKRSPPPFITSTLQQAASGRFGLSPARTMVIAQKLYEGIDLGSGSVGLITYMRTDSFNVSRDAVAACRSLVVERFGKDYCPAAPNVFRSRKSAQEAHEAIRPTDVRRTPESISRHLDAQSLKLYTLIWQRFVASQMSAAKINQRTVSVQPAPSDRIRHDYIFRATASDVAFPGFMKVAGMNLKGDKEGEDEDQRLPALSEGEPLECVEWLSERKETRPPPRYSEASLVRALESNGVGRPSTYAQILSTLINRGYVTRERRTLTPTDLGMRVNDLLVESLDSLFDVKFTASMEDALDEVEEGRIEWTKMLDDFYAKFDSWMQATREPPADTATVEGTLDLLNKVREWAPPVKRGKRTFSDERFVESLRRQLDEGGRDVTGRQLEALLRIACRYAGQVPEIEDFMKAAGREDLLNQPPEAGPSDKTLRKFKCLAGIDLDESTAKFVDSLRSRADGGRALTGAQVGALDRIVLDHAAQIENFDELSAELGVAPPEPREEDAESGLLLGALESVRSWREPVTRGKRVFDDEKFYRSLSAHYKRKRFLSPRQKSALKRMVGRYKDQVPEFDKLAEICRTESRKKE